MHFACFILLSKILCLAALWNWTPVLFSQYYFWHHCRGHHLYGFTIDLWPQHCGDVFGFVPRSDTFNGSRCTQDGTQEASGSIHQESSICIAGEVWVLFMGLSLFGRVHVVITQNVNIGNISRKHFFHHFSHHDLFSQATPTLIGNFGREALRHTLLSPATPVRVLAFGGETCPTLAQINHMRSAGNTKTTFYNLYGITEVSSWASCYRIDTEGQTDEECDSMER